MLVESKTPAWQRLQAVHAIEAYRDSVLNTKDPCLNDITATLKHLTAREEALGQDTIVTATDEERMVGIIDENEPVIIQDARREMRLHYK